MHQLVDRLFRIRAQGELKPPGLLRQHEPSCDEPRGAALQQKLRRSSHALAASIFFTLLSNGRVSAAEIQFSTSRKLRTISRHSTIQSGTNPSNTPLNYKAPGHASHPFFTLLDCKLDSALKVLAHCVPLVWVPGIKALVINTRFDIT